MDPVSFPLPPAESGSRNPSVLQAQGQATPQASPWALKPSLMQARLSCPSSASATPPSSGQEPAS